MSDHAELELAADVAPVDGARIDWTYADELQALAAGELAHWTREAIIAAIREWTDWYGRPPAKKDWDPHRARTNGQAWRAGAVQPGRVAHGEDGAARVRQLVGRARGGAVAAGRRRRVSPRVGRGSPAERSLSVPGESSSGTGARPAGQTHGRRSVRASATTSTPGCTAATSIRRGCLAVVLVHLCAFVWVVAVGRLADGLVALGERAKRRDRRCDRCR